MKSYLKSPNRSMTAFATLLLLLSAGSGILSSCESKKAFSNLSIAGSPDADINAADLQESLLEFDVYFETTMVSAANQVKADSPLNEIDRNTSRLKSITNRQIRDFIYQQDPAESLLDTWSYCLRLRDHFNSPEGAKLFGPGRTVLLTEMDEMIREIESIAVQYLPPQDMDAIRKYVIDHAVRFPMTGFLDDSAANADPASLKSLQSVGNLVMLPFSPLLTFKKVNDTGDQIREFNQTAARFAEIAEDLPRELRWESEVFLLTALESEQIASALKNLEESAEAADRISRLSETWPEQTGLAVRNALKEFENARPGIEELLKQAQSIATNLDSSMEKADRISGRAEATALQVEKVLLTSDDTIRTLNQTATIVQEIMTSLEAMNSERDPDSEPVTPEKIQKVADTVLQATIETRELLADLQNLKSPEALDQISSKITSASDEAALKSRDVVDYAFWRLVQFAVLVFVLGTAWLGLQRIIRKTNTSS